MSDLPAEQHLAGPLTAADLAPIARQRQWTPEQCQALYAARQRGVTLRVLAQEHGVSTERIRHLAAKGQRLPGPPAY